MTSFRMTDSVGLGLPTMGILRLSLSFLVKTLAVRSRLGSLILGATENKFGKLNHKPRHASMRKEKQKTIFNNILKALKMCINVKIYFLA